MSGQELSRPRWRRRPLRLSVRALMALILILGGLYGWIVHRAHIQRDAVAAVRHAGGEVIYDLVFPHGHPIKQSMGTTYNPGFSSSAPWAPKWLVGRVGIDYFANVIQVSFDRPITDADLAHVGRFYRLQRLYLAPSSVTDAGLAHLEGLTELHFLHLAASDVDDAGLAHLKGLVNLDVILLQQTKVTDAGLKYLGGLSHIGQLHLRATRITDAGLRHLTGLKSLYLLNVRSTGVTDAGVTEFRRALPRVEIFH
jgi:internalin A